MIKIEPKKLDKKPRKKLDKKLDKKTDQKLDKKPQKKQPKKQEQQHPQQHAQPIKTITFIFNFYGVDMPSKPTKKSEQNKKVATVMREYASGRLKSSSGQKVTNPSQAKAIAMSEAGKKKK